MMRSVARIARVQHRCDCGNRIQPGDPYMHCVASPNDPDLGNTRWASAAECEACARRYGRGDQIDARVAVRLDRWSGIC